MLKLLAIALLLLATSGEVAACGTLDQQLAHDEPIVKARLLTLKPGERLAGVRLCDGSVVFAGWRFLRPARIQRAHQHVLLFRVGKSMRAVAWVDARGAEIPVPACPYGDRCPELPEAANVISDDVYTFATIRPKGNVLTARYPPERW